MSLDGKFLDVYYCQPRPQETDGHASGSTADPFEPSPAPVVLPDTMSPKRICVDDYGRGRLSAKTLREIIGATHDQVVRLETVQPSHESLAWARSLRLVHCPTGDGRRLTNISACTVFGVTGLTGNVLVVRDFRLPHDLNARDQFAVTAEQERKAQESDQRQWTHHHHHQPQQAAITFGTSASAQPAAQIATGTTQHFWIPPSPYPTK